MGRFIMNYQKNKLIFSFTKFKSVDFLFLKK